MRRWFLFFISIVLGVTIGIFLGYVLFPLEYTNTDLETLKSDYKTDYVLMVAEAFAFDGNAISATRRLTDLESTQPLEIVRQAILFAEQAGYNQQDLERMRTLQNALGEAASQEGRTLP